MARPVPIGEYTPQVPVQEGMRRIVPEQSGFSTGSAMEELGNSAQRAQNVVTTVQAHHYNALALPQLRTAADMALQDSIENATPDGSDPKELKDQTGVLPRAMDTFEKAYKQALQDAPNALSKRMIDESAANIREELKQRASAHDAVTRVVQRATTAEKGITLATTSVETNPDSWQQANKEQQTTIAGLALGAQETARLQQKADTEIREAAARGLAKSDPDGVLSRLKDSKDELLAPLDQGARERLEAYATSQSTQNHADGIVAAMRAAGPDAAAKAFTALDKSDLPQAQKDRILAAAHGGIEQLHAERAQQYADQLTKTETAIASGNLTGKERADAAFLYQKGAYSQPQYAAALSGIARAEKKTTTDDDGMAAILDAYKNHTPLDPKDSVNKKGIDTLFGALTTGQQPGSPGYVNAAADITAKTGVIPTSSLSWARANLSGGNPQQAASAAALIDKLQTVNPTAYALSGEDAETKAMAHTINSAVTAGTDPQLAVNMARENAKLSKTDETFLQTKWNKQFPVGTDKSADDMGAIVKGLKGDPHYAGGFFGPSVPTPPLAMAAEFNDLTHQYFQHTGGNLQQAQQLALNDLKGVWGVSQVNGKRDLMKYAPERMFPGLTAETVRTDLEASVPKGEFDPKQAQLRESPETASSGGRNWYIAAPDKFGAFDIVRDKSGLPLRYQLPLTHKDYATVQGRLEAQDRQALLDKQQRDRAMTAFKLQEQP